MVADSSGCAIRTDTERIAGNYGAVRTVALVLVLASAGSALARSAERPWRPDVAAAKRYAQHRHADAIAFAVRTPTRTWGWHAYRTFPSASLVKAILLVAYLDRPSVRSRPLRGADRALLAPMIRRSNNDAASRVLAIDGPRAVYAVARRAGMRRFRLVMGTWGFSRVDAADQSRFFLRIDRLVAPRHRAYAMRLLNTITPVQRWGVARVRPSGWRLYFKGGWGSGTGWVDHQTALLTRGGQRVSLSILTFEDGSHTYGTQTLKGIAARLLKGLARAGDVP
jgi:hypothetical protein